MDQRRICLNLLNEPDGRGTVMVVVDHDRQILCAIRAAGHPFPAGARPEGPTLYERNRPAFEQRLRQEADKYRKRPLPDDDDDDVVVIE